MMIDALSFGLECQITFRVRWGGQLASNQALRFSTAIRFASQEVSCHCIVSETRDSKLENTDFADFQLLRCVDRLSRNNCQMNHDASECVTRIE